MKTPTVDNAAILAQSALSGETKDSNHDYVGMALQAITTKRVGNYKVSYNSVFSKVCQLVKSKQGSTVLSNEVVSSISNAVKSVIQGRLVLVNLNNIVTSKRSTVYIPSEAVYMERVINEGRNHLSLDEQLDAGYGEMAALNKKLAKLEQEIEANPASAESKRKEYEVDMANLNGKVRRVKGTIALLEKEIAAQKTIKQ